MRRNNRKTKWFSFQKILWGIAGLLVVAMVFVAGIKASNHQSEAKSSTPKPEKTEKSQPAASSSSSSVAVSASSASDSSSELDDLLSPLTATAGEDSDTRTGGDVTYSCFYRKSGTWYWQLSSDNRGMVEVGEVRSVKSDGDKEVLAMTSRSAEPGATYNLEFHWLDQSQTRYQVHTDFESINGNYTIGQLEDHSDSETQDAMMMRTLGSGTGKENASTRTNGGEVTYSYFFSDGDDWYWELSSEKRGDIEFGKVISIERSNGSPSAIKIRSEQPDSEGDVYTLSIDFNDNNMSYTLSTNYDNIYGSYSITDDY